MGRMGRSRRQGRSRGRLAGIKDDEVRERRAIAIVWLIADGDMTRETKVRQVCSRGGESRCADCKDREAASGARHQQAAASSHSVEVGWQRAMSWPRGRGAAAKLRHMYGLWIRSHGGGSSVPPRLDSEAVPKIWSSAMWAILQSRDLVPTSTWASAALVILTVSPA